MNARPQLWVFAGPNGAGKSTLVERFHVARKVVVVNPDIIARKIDPNQHGEPAVMLKAGRIATLERRAHIEKGRSFAIETTLTGHSELRLMREAQLAGYKVTLVFVGLENASTSFVRVRERVAQGGHDVPTSFILRRYAKSLANLSVAIGPAARCFLLDNSGVHYRLLITIEDGFVRYQSHNLPAWAKAATEA